MKLIAENYISPMETDGIYPLIEVVDTQLIINSEDTYFSVKLDTFSIKGEKRILLGSQVLGFYGNENDEVSSNRTTTISIPNPDYDPGTADSEEKLIVPMLDYLAAHNGELPAGYEMVDYGYPTAEKAKQMFSGGTLASPKIFLTDPFAKAWLLNTASFKNELLVHQLRFVE